MFIAVCVSNVFVLSYYLYSTQFPYYSMDKRKMEEVSKDKKTQYCWSKLMSKELLRSLANKVKKGN